MCKFLIKNHHKKNNYLWWWKGFALFTCRSFRFGYSIITTTNGKECIYKYKELHTKASVDLILVDYRLKDMDGDQVACEINKTNGVKIMLISAYELEKEKLVIKFIENVFWFLSKTTGVKKLIDEVSKILS